MIFGSLVPLFQNGAAWRLNRIKLSRISASGGRRVERVVRPLPGSPRRLLISSPDIPPSLSVALKGCFQRFSVTLPAND